MYQNDQVLCEPTGQHGNLFSLGRSPGQWMTSLDILMKSNFLLFFYLFPQMSINLVIKKCKISLKLKCRTQSITNNAGFAYSNWHAHRYCVLQYQL